MRKIEIEDLFSLRLVTGADARGDLVVFAVSRQDLKKNATYSSLYSVPLRGGRVRRLTRGEHVDRAPRFSPDGTRLAFLSNRERKTSALWLLPMEGGEAERITDLDGDVFDFSWSPDGKSLAVMRRALTEHEKLVREGKTEEAGQQPHYRHVKRLVYKLDGEGFLSGEPVKIWLVPADGGRMRPLTTGEWDDVEPRFSPDGARVSFLSNRRKDRDLAIDQMDIYSVGLDGKGLRKLTREGGVAQGHGWTPDGRFIVYVGHLGGIGEGNLHNLHVRRIPANGGKGVDLTPDLDRHAANMVIGDTAGTSFGGPPPVVTADGERILFPITDQGTCRIVSVSIDGGEPQAVLDGLQTVLDFGIPAGGAAGWAIVGDMTNPSDVWRFDPAGERPPRQLTKLNRNLLSKRAVVVPEEVRFRRKGGEVHGWILKPPGFRAGRKYPMVLEVHGGPHVGYGHVFFHEMQLLAARGYVVLMTNPRGSDGYGLDHRTAIHKAWGGVDTDDLMTALDGLLRKGYVDRKRVYLTGGSYGGYMTNWLVGHTNRFRAAVTQRSVVNLSSFFGNSDFGYYFQWELGGTPWDEEDHYRKLSPFTYADRIETPLLIIHSEEDHRCPIGQAEELFVRLKLLGREVEMIRFVGESHGLSRGGRPQNRAERLRRILDWFGRHR